MNDQSTDHFVDHVGHSIGGFGGHAFRRLTHVSMASIPYLYYVHGEVISSYFSLQAREFVSAICILILIIEAVRLRSGIVIVGQREYESNQISALAWGALAVALAILIAPEGENGSMEAGKYGAPIILGMTLVDPVMGEVKRTQKNLRTAIIAGLAVSYAVWIGCHFWIGTELIAALLLAPLTVLGELPPTRAIDDNATMVLFPLFGLVLLLPFL
ncbi:MAG: hypothetical protein QF736_02155 [Candidatus Thalassarchaeaceae archaeon]|nr:hypothetical protein [Candidatus Thalassarchaeaceae archaeon]|tara:strand:+ start:2359 stop:3003 length:645 start_codon:yes stop_codon:yes gene_type:complete